MIPIGFSVIVLLVLPPLPEKLKWGFTKEEKEIALRRQKEAHMDAGGRKFHKEHVPLVFKDPKLYGFGKSNSDGDEVAEWRN